VPVVIRHSPSLPAFSASLGLRTARPVARLQLPPSALRIASWPQGVSQQTLSIVSKSLVSQHDECIRVELIIDPLGKFALLFGDRSLGLLMFRWLFRCGRCSISGLNSRGRLGAELLESLGDEVLYTGASFPPYGLFHYAEVPAHLSTEALPQTQRHLEQKICLALC